MPVNSEIPSRSDRLAKAVGAGCLLAIAVWTTVQDPPGGALFFLMPVVAYWQDVKTLIRRIRRASP